MTAQQRREGERALDPAHLLEANINPATGLHHDYLNHFNEAIMMLESLATMPDCLDDLLGWKPESYHEHFAASGLRHRDLAISAYDAADPRARSRLEELAATMNVILVSVRETLRLNQPLREKVALAREAAVHLKPLVARASAVINGTYTGAGRPRNPQRAVDALLKR